MCGAARTDNGNVHNNNDVGVCVEQVLHCPKESLFLEPSARLHTYCWYAWSQNRHNFPSGQQGVIHITRQDRFGNSIGPLDCPPLPYIESSKGLAARLQEGVDGSLTLTYTATTAGTYSLCCVGPDGETYCGSPWTVTVDPAEVLAETCEARLVGGRRSVAGREVHVAVCFKDRFGNQVRSLSCGVLVFISHTHKRVAEWCVFEWPVIVPRWTMQQHVHWRCGRRAQSTWRLIPRAVHAQLELAATGCTLQSAARPLLAGRSSCTWLQTSAMRVAASCAALLRQGPSAMWVSSRCCCCRHGMPLATLHW